MILHIRPPDTPPLAPPSGGRVWLSESGLGVQLVRLAQERRRLNRQPRGHKRVMVIPGWKAPQWTMEPVRRYLRSLGHDVVHWGYGINRGQPERDRDRLVQMLREDGRPLSLIGWSLGGVIAREVAREIPDQIEHVFTYGTPVLGGPSYTRGAAFFGEDECTRIRQLIEEAQENDPIQVPLTIVYSKLDAVVAWGACIDASSPRARHYEVTTSHVGMGLDPDVWCLCAQRLAQR